MVRTIRAIPPSLSGGSKSLLLQIERCRSVPFITPKKIQVPPASITLSEPLWKGEKEQIQKEIEAMERKKQRADYFSVENGGLLTLPLRQGGYYMLRGFQAVKRAFTGQGLLQFHVKGYNITWKLDHKTAWALEEGQALDKLVNIKFV